MVSQGAGFVIALADACDPGSGYPPRSPGLQTGTLYYLLSINQLPLLANRGSPTPSSGPSSSLR